MGPVLYPEENYGIVSYLIFPMSFSITFKKKTLAHGSHPDCSVGQWVKWVNRCDPLSTLTYETSPYAYGPKYTYWIEQ